eukprot:m.474050 g.474050  ORF g.474050 m.474050 type:complete len:125 (-) comp35600_c0_seq1:61-435(-)
MVDIEQICGIVRGSVGEALSTRAETTPPWSRPEPDPPHKIQGKPRTQKTLRLQAPQWGIWKGRVSDGDGEAALMHHHAIEQYTTSTTRRHPLIRVSSAGRGGTGPNATLRTVQGGLSLKHTAAH